MAPLRPGVYAPIMTFFAPTTQDLDLSTLTAHSLRLAKAGLTGLVVMGSNGEAVHLSSSEKTTITTTVRTALDSGGFRKVSLMVGCSAQSVRGTIDLCRSAHAAGGDSALIVPPSYYRYAMDTEAIVDYFDRVADGSPIPIVIYNYPGAVAGIDLDSDVLLRISRHENIVGTKFTCGNTGKLSRVALETDAVTPNTQGEGGEGGGYMAFAGMADFLLQGLVAGGSGVIAGGANVAPRACVRVYDLFKAGRFAEAMDAQKRLAKGDWVLTRSAIPGTKAVLQRYFGYGGEPRAPLRVLGEEEVRGVCEGVWELMKWEEELEDAF